MTIQPGGGQLPHDIACSRAGQGYFWKWQEKLVLQKLLLPLLLLLLRRLNIKNF
jgi:hypothetical protein